MEKRDIFQLLKPFVSLYAAVFFMLAAMSLLTTFLSLRLSMAGVSVQTTGLVLTAYYAGLTLGTFICGGMIRQVGHIRAFAAFAAVSTAVVLVHGVAVNVPLWICLRLICGIGNTGMFMVLESWLNECAEPGARGRVFSMYMIMTYLGATLGQKLLTMAGVEEQTLFLLVGVFMALSIVPVVVTRSIHPELPEPAQIKFCKIFRRTPIGMAGVFIAGLLLSAFYAMGPVFAHDINMDVDQLSWFMTLSVLGGLLFQWPVGAISDRIDRSLVLPALGIILAGIAILICIFFGRSINTLLGASVFFGGILFTLYPVAVARAHDLFEPKDVVKVSSALLLVYGIGSVIGPVAAPWAMALARTPFGLYYFFAAGSLSFAVFALAWRWMESVKIIPADEQVDFVIMTDSANVAMHMDPRLEPEDLDGDHKGAPARCDGEQAGAGKITLQSQNLCGDGACSS
ncbi:MAG: MFS transporter [Desulfobacter sp.]|nr:MAG: MFS transporter [Desulfobacter sp.]